MRIEKEILKLRKKISLLNLRINHLTLNNSKLKKLVMEKKVIRRNNREKRRISYIDRMEIERRMKNLIGQD